MVTQLVVQNDDWNLVYATNFDDVLVNIVNEGYSIVLLNEATAQSPPQPDQPGVSLSTKEKSYAEATVELKQGKQLYVKRRGNSVGIIVFQVEIL